jgi:penicillin-binding protein 1A
LYVRQPDQLGQVIDPRNVAMMNTMMQETLLSGTAHKAELPGWMAAGKTGTSQDFRDAWFIGYTSKLVTGVWLGNDDSSPTKKATGGGLPVEIWTRFMRAAHQGVPVATLPNSQAPGFFSNLAQAAPPSGGPQPGPQATASQITAPNAPPAPGSLAPMPPAGGYRPSPTRASNSTRPEAAAGLDGWLVQRLFGGR